VAAFDGTSWKAFEPSAYIKSVEFYVAKIDGPLPSRTPRQ